MRTFHNHPGISVADKVMDPPGSPSRSITANSDVVTVLMSYSDNRTIQLLMQSGAEYSTRALSSPIFWHSRVETLMKKRVPLVQGADWKETYYILERELKKKVRPSIYNQEDNALASRLLADRLLEEGASNQVFIRSITEVILGGKINILKFVLSDHRFDALIKEPLVGLLNRATYHGQLEVVKLLLSDPRVLPTGDELISAASASRTDVPIENYIELVRIFLADPHIDPRTDGDLSISEERDTPEIMQLLLDDGRADPMADNGKPLTTAAQNGRVWTLAVLLSDPRADPTIVYNGELLIHSVRARQLAVVHLLLRDGRIDPNRDDGAALITAIRDDQTEIALTLLSDERTDPSLADNWALTEAIKNDNGPVVDVLLTRTDVVDNLSEEDLELAEQIGNPNMITTIRDALDR